jgi:ABC-type Na+ efflux pump permease subunit
MPGFGFNLMKSSKILPCGALAFGSLIVIAGITFIVLYVLEAVIARRGEPDQSLLFWYLPVLFLALIGMVIGLGVSVWGLIRLREIRRQTSLSTSQHL